MLKVSKRKPCGDILIDNHHLPTTYIRDNKKKNRLKISSQVTDILAAYILGRNGNSFFLLTLSRPSNIL